MTYCKAGDKLSIEYFFGDGKREKIKLDQAPIEIELSSSYDKYTENFRAEGYWIEYYSPNNSRGFSFPIRDYKIGASTSYNYDLGKPDPPSTRRQAALFVLTCPDSNFYDMGIVDLDTIRIDYSRTCGNTSTEIVKQICKIEIKYEGATIHSAEGECPCTFTVACKDCPEGYLKCPTTKFPGYCCIPCKSTAAKIAAIKEQVRRFNRG